MNIDLTGLTALVTGSTAGIGRAAALSLARSGARVIVNGRTAESVDAALRALVMEAPDAPHAGFVGDLSLGETAVELAQDHPHVDILVNNLGVYTVRDFFDIPDTEWMRLFETNIMSGVRLSRAYAPGMIERGWGRIVFVASESALNTPVSMMPYAMTKTAQLAVSRGLAKRLAGTGVTVNAVLPGPTMTEGLAEMLAEETKRTGKSVEQAGIDFVKTWRSSSIIGRPISVEEVANMIAYVCSREASATTGAALRVDGGVVDTIA